MPRFSTKRLEISSSAEWLLTNGLGGYAMGALSGANTRRYHGLLVAAALPPVGRVVALHSVIDEIDIDGQTFALAVQHFGDEPIVHPEGWRWLEEVIVDVPNKVRWRFRAAGIEIVRTLRLVAGRNAARLTYERFGSNSGPVVLRMHPLVALRDFHSLNRDGDASLAISCERDKAVRVTRSGFAMDLTVTRGGFVEAPDWWRNFSYLLDRDRGQEWHEDLFTPGRFEIELSETNPHAELLAELLLPHVETPALRPTARGDAAVADRSDLIAGKARERLQAAAGQFIVHRRVGEINAISVIAGYPWFADWGRDTMISLPGLFLATGRFEDAERTLLAFARHVRNGLIPNRFDDYGGGAHYNTVDASLWFIHAVSETLAAYPRAAARGELITACREIVAAYSKGTDFNIRMDPADALIAAGDVSTQLTWMDAQRDGVTFTPRHGKAIEINALWHHALHSMTSLADDPDERAHFQKLAERVAQSIQRLFWCEKTRCCYDVLTKSSEGWIGDDSIRPNQILAVSLSPSPLGAARQKSILSVVREKLLTPFGLRTLDPGNPNYRGRFEGSLFDRDAAYHQGTVWPWLIGPYCEAVLRVSNFSADATQEVGKVVQPLLNELDTGSPGTCIGQIAEVYDGDAPHRPGGCPAQAWSVAELLRVLELLATRSPQRTPRAQRI